MLNKEATAALSRLSTRSLGVFRGSDAIALGVSRNQLTALVVAGTIERVLPDVSRMTVVARSTEQRLRAALLWAGDDAAAGERSAGETYGLHGVHAQTPDIYVPASRCVRSPLVTVHQCIEFRPLMVRLHRGLRVTGVEATLVALAHALDAEAFAIACEDARRRGLTGVPALRTYLERFGRKGLPGVAATRDFVREFPLSWNGRTYRFDFCFEQSRSILETNGRRWHDDPADSEGDNDKWIVPGRHGYRIVFATWEKVARHPDDFLRELTASMTQAA